MSDRILEERLICTTTAIRSFASKIRLEDVDELTIARSAGMLGVVDPDLAPDIEPGGLSKHLRHLLDQPRPRCSPAPVFD